MDHAISAELRLTRKAPKRKRERISIVDLSKDTNFHDIDNGKPFSHDGSDGGSVDARPRCASASEINETGEIDGDEIDGDEIDGDRQPHQLKEPPNNQTAVKTPVPSDWKILAAVLDRIFFLAYMLLISIIIHVLIPRPK